MFGNLVLRPYEKRFILALIIVGVLAYMFWTGSRYPALNDKAVMSGAIQLEDVLSFEAKYPITPEMGIVQHLFYSTLNWIATNRKGMTFGILFAAAFLTAAGYLKQKSFRGSFQNSFLGLALGTPLGVCVNCAAPIARGMYSGGMRAETTLSAMVASPTLNVVVLTMLFSLVPIYMAVTKVVLSLLVILLAVPLLVRILPPPREAALRAAPAADRPAVAPVSWTPAELAGGAAVPATKGESLPRAVWEVAKAYLKNLWYILKMTLPLMLLAGFLGTVVAVALPGETIMGLPFSVLVLIAVALVGVVLPVPIGFDVVMAGALLAAGLKQGYVMALLFTLGSFSIYSFFIVAQAMGRRIAFAMAGCIALLGLAAGLGAQSYNEWQTDRALRLLTGEAETAAPAPAFETALGTTSAAPLPRILQAAQAAEAPPWQVTSADAGRIGLTATPFAPRSAGTGGFTRLEARAAGIDAPLEFSMADMWPPFWEGRSLATGDLDNDGDPDLVVSSTEAGLYLYRNDGTGQFAPYGAELGEIADWPVFNTIVADIDNDGWRDLVIATYRQGNYLWRNRNGAFTGAPEPLENVPGAILSMAMTLGDPDRDGDLDLALGNWASGWYRRVPGEESRNRILWNDGGRLGARATDLPGIPGETLSILFTDTDRDGAADLVVGNDFAVPDYVYKGDGTGALTAITHQQGLLPHTTTTTMAVKSADLMNDGKVELYFAQIAGRSSGVSKRLKMQPLARYCDGIEDAESHDRCAANMAIKAWYRSGNSFDPTYASKCAGLTGRTQAECKAMLIKDLAIQRGDAAICELIPDSQPRPKSFCQVHFLPVRTITEAEAEAAIPQILRSNVLLEPQDGGAYADTAPARGLEVGGWSWDTKIADFDNDGLQDIYIVNGTWVPNEVSPSNLYFRNQGDGSFVEASGEMGLEDYLMTAAATVFDIDGDGDLDMVTHPVNGPLALFRNDSQEGNAIAFTLEDHAGNRDGIGAVVTILDESGRRQSREVQLGGGFMSFDAPLVHFGLGSDVRVEEVTVRWADGSETRIEGPLPAGSLYRLRRAA